MRTFDDRNIVFIFLTDGQATDGRETNYALKTFPDIIKNHKKNVTIHVQGIGSSHDYSLLEVLRACGHSEGIYQFAKNTTDSEAIMNMLESMIGFASDNIECKLLLDDVGLLITNGGERI